MVYEKEYTVESRHLFYHIVYKSKTECFKSDRSVRLRPSFAAKLDRIQGQIIRWSLKFDLSELDWTTQVVIMGCRF